MYSMLRVAKKSTSLVGEGGLHHVGRAGHDRTARVVHRVTHERPDVGQDREEHEVERLLVFGLVLVKEQVVDVRLRDLRRVAGIDRPVLSTFDPHLFGRRVGEDDVLLLDADGLEVRPEPGRRHVDVEHPRNADADRASLLPALLARAHERPLDGDAPDAEESLSDLDVADRRTGFGHRRLVVEVTKRLLRFEVDEVRKLAGDFLAVGHESEHRFFGLDGPLLAGKSSDVAAGRAVGALGVDERSLALVRTEVTDGLFVVLRGVVERDGRIHADEAARLLPRHDAECLHRGADRAGFARVRVHVHLGARHALFDVVDLRLDGCHVVLGATLQHVLGAERGEPRDLHDVLPDVLR